MTATPEETTTGPERATRGEVPAYIEEAAWHRPEYVVVETALEVTAYSLASR
ncbi:pyrroloquinoline quinone precursor peptide PqqA [Streptomyces sp. NPDC096176]|uniref:pyrroloquinoline quinone precursor peptide PqqA n=1 Tax=Streptomyces sp. NPDC096176 TaxID=3366079 RepID=UPI00381730D5